MFLSWLLSRITEENFPISLDYLTPSKSSKALANSITEIMWLRPLLPELLKVYDNICVTYLHAQVAWELFET